MKLAYDTAGDGPCVLLVHGHPFDRSLWQPQVSALADHFRVVAPDLRGFGESPVTAGFVSLSEYANDVVDLLERLDADRAAVVGLSMGGLVAMELVTNDPKRWWALGLVATTAEPVTAHERRMRLERADQVDRAGLQVLIDHMQTGLYGSRSTPTIRASVDAMMARGSGRGAAAALRGRAERPDYRPRLAALDLPAFVCTGSDDPWSTTAVTAEIVAHLRNPETLLLEGVGHLPNLEAEETFNKALIDFLRRHAPAEQR